MPSPVTSRGLVSKRYANLASRLHNSLNFQSIFINEVLKSKLNLYSDIPPLNTHIFETDCLILLFPSYSSIVVSIVLLIKSDLSFFQSGFLKAGCYCIYPARYNLLILLTSEGRHFFSNLFTLRTPCRFSILLQSDIYYYYTSTLSQNEFCNLTGSVVFCSGI